ncbi:hypothetical protein BC940DRAFT_313002 [Gongronella butleri]|nr:hypothetical protein BC940DRAFT_313002 [Gongronella butleri]
MALRIEPAELLTFHRNIMQNETFCAILLTLYGALLGPLTVVTKEILKVSNENDEPVIFKVKTTAPKQYCVRPNAGRVEPHSSVEVQVILQPFKQEPPLDTRCKDKFLVQSTLAPPADASMPLTDMWTKIETTKSSPIHQHKIKCAFADVTKEEAAAEPVVQDAVVPEPIVPVAAAAIDTKDAEQHAPSAAQEYQRAVQSEPAPAIVHEEPVQHESETTPATKDTTFNATPSIPSTTSNNHVASAHTTRESPSPSSPPKPAPEPVFEKPAPVPEPIVVKPAAVPEPTVEKSVPVPAPRSVAPAVDKTKEKEINELKKQLSAANVTIVSLRSDLAQAKQDADTLRARQPPSVVPTQKPSAPTSPLAQKLAPNALPLDAVHQHLAQLQKPRPVEGYPPQVVAALCFMTFVVAYLFF